MRIGVKLDDRVVKPSFAVAAVFLQALACCLSVGVFGKSFLTGEPQRLMQGFLDRKK